MADPYLQTNIETLTKWRFNVNSRALKSCNSIDNYGRGKCKNGPQAESRMNADFDLAINRSDLILIYNNISEQSLSRSIHLSNAPKLTYSESQIFLLNFLSSKWMRELVTLVESRFTCKYDVIKTWIQVSMSTCWRHQS